MTIPRINAGAAVIDGKPAIIGGQTTGAAQHISTTETYNGSVWSIDEDLSLHSPRAQFGLTKF